MKYVAIVFYLLSIPPSLSGFMLQRAFPCGSGSPLDSGCGSCIQVFDHIDGILRKAQFLHGEEKGGVINHIEGTSEVY